MAFAKQASQKGPERMRAETGKLRSVHPPQNPENRWLRSFWPLREPICPDSSSEFLFLPATNPYYAWKTAGPAHAGGLGGFYKMRCRSGL
jgi:hypothetical protein